MRSHVNSDLWELVTFDSDMLAVFHLFEDLRLNQRRIGYGTKAARYPGILSITSLSCESSEIN